MDKKRLAFLGLLVLFVGAYLGSPLWAAHSLMNAIQAGDADRIDSLSNMPAIRESLKSQFLIAFHKKTSSDPTMADNPVASLVTAFASVAVDKMIDSFVTPDGLAAIMKGRKPGEEGGNGVQLNSENSSSSEYLDLDHFRMKLLDKSNASGNLSLIFERYGIFSWKLIRITLHPGFFDDGKADEVSAPIPHDPLKTSSPPVPNFSLPPDQTHAATPGVDWSQIIPAASASAGVEDCDRPILISQTRSLNGGYIYQQVCHWATSGDIVQVRISDGRRREVTSGNSLAVIRNGPWRGFLLIRKHKYYTAPKFGSYDSMWVIRPDGKEMFVVPGSQDGRDATVETWLRSNGWTAD